MVVTDLAPKGSARHLVFPLSTHQKGLYPMNTRTTSARWTVDRAVPLLAGFMILVSLALATGLSTWWLLLTAFVAANLLLFAAVGWCPASLLMHRLGLPRRTELR
ncbi:hypothetical protein C7458_11937 [Williamsia muralis]|nr:hypothetical protein C7458_11937 [Williamsia marianensis]